MTYQVYLASLDGVPRYVGCGKPNRHHHVNSGTSHVRKLNEMVLKYDKTFDVAVIKSGLTKADAEQLEHEEIERIGREDLGTGSLWNSTSGWGFLHGGHTEETKQKIREASKRKWADLTEEGRAEYIEKLRAAPNSGRWVKGQKAHNAGKIGVYGKNWRLINNVTGAVYVFFNRKAFILSNPEFAFIRDMAKDHHYTCGKRKGWYLTEVTL